MKFGYIVNHNGIYYKAGEDVPVEDKKEFDLEEEINSPEMDENVLPFSDDDIEMDEEPIRRGRPRKSDL